MIYFNITAAIEKFNKSLLNGQEIRVMWSSHTLVYDKKGCNLFVKNFPNTYSQSQLKETSKKYGAVLSCKVCAFFICC